MARLLSYLCSAIASLRPRLRTAHWAVRLTVRPQRPKSSDRISLAASLWLHWLLFPLSVSLCLCPSVCVGRTPVVAAEAGRSNPGRTPVFAPPCGCVPGLYWPRPLGLNCVPVRRTWFQLRVAPLVFFWGGVLFTGEICICACCCNVHFVVS